MPRKTLASIGVAIAIVLALAGVLTHQNALRLALADTERRGDNTLQLANTTLTGQLARYERLPPLIARQAVVRALAANPKNSESVAEANVYLKEIQRQLGASDIYFMDLQGTTRAASNFDTETSFIEGNFAFRPYFFDALAKGDGRFYAIGTTSQKRGYYFGAPVMIEGRAAGVVAFKVDLDSIEEAWRGGDYEILVTDPEGVIFLASQRDWLFSATQPLTAPQRLRLEETRRYADVTVRDLPVTKRDKRDEYQLVTVAKEQGSTEYLLLSQPRPEADWTVSVMVDTAAAHRQAMTAAVLVVLGLGLAAMATAIVLQRRARLRERLALQQAAQAELEQRVTERTHELGSVNRQLQAEVAERRAAEQNLRKAQADLVQAGKLAALGQMSAALSHEFNQPLGAARTYADNALVLMDRDRLPEARDNIGRILSLVDRMASISRHLRSFARKPGQKLVAVDLADVVVVAQEIAMLRLDAAKAELSVDIPADLPPLLAGPVRLQQVLVNLLTNAADAIEGLPDRRITLAARPTEAGVRITIRDHGPGVPAGLAERIFDPFFSTKTVGKGLGLGLSDLIQHHQGFWRHPTGGGGRRWRGAVYN